MFIPNFLTIPSPIPPTSNLTSPICGIGKEIDTDELTKKKDNSQTQRMNVWLPMRDHYASTSDEKTNIQEDPVTYLWLCYALLC